MLISGVKPTSLRVLYHNKACDMIDQSYHKLACADLPGQNLNLPIKINTQTILNTKLAELTILRKHSILCVYFKDYFPSFQLVLEHCLNSMVSQWFTVLQVSKGKQETC